MMLYRTLAGLAAITTGTVVFFFVTGLADGSVSSFNIGLWLALLALAIAPLAGGIALHRQGRTGAGRLLLALLAVPAVIGGLVLLVLIVNPPHWN
jgi:ABC-type spermidine/putrescine transport system permease subunit II